MITIRTNSTDSNEDKSKRRKCQRLINYVFGKGPYPLSDIDIFKINKEHIAQIMSEIEQHKAKGIDNDDYIRLEIIIKPDDKPQILCVYKVKMSNNLLQSPSGDKKSNAVDKPKANLNMLNSEKLTHCLKFLSPQKNKPKNLEQNEKSCRDSTEMNRLKVTEVSLTVSDQKMTGNKSNTLEKPSTISTQTNSQKLAESQFTTSESKKTDIESQEWGKSSTLNTQTNQLQLLHLPLRVSNQKKTDIESDGLERSTTITNEKKPLKCTQLPHAVPIQKKNKIESDGLEKSSSIFTQKKRSKLFPMIFKASKQKKINIEADRLKRDNIKVNDDKLMKMLMNNSYKIYDNNQITTIPSKQPCEATALKVTSETKNKQQYINEGVKKKTSQTHVFKKKYFPKKETVSDHSNVNIPSPNKKPDAYTFVPIPSSNLPVENEKSSMMKELSQQVHKDFSSESVNMPQQLHKDSIAKPIKTSQQLHKNSIAETVKVPQQFHQHSIAEPMKTSQQMHKDNTKEVAKIPAQFHENPMVESMKTFQQVHKDFTTDNNFTSEVTEMPQELYEHSTTDTVEKSQQKQLYQNFDLSKAYPQQLSWGSPNLRNFQPTYYTHQYRQPEQFQYMRTGLATAQNLDQSKFTDPLNHAFQNQTPSQHFPNIWTIPAESQNDVEQSAGQTEPQCFLSFNYPWNQNPQQLESSSSNIRNQTNIPIIIDPTCSLCKRTYKTKSEHDDK